MVKDIGASLLWFQLLGLVHTEACKVEYGQVLVNSQSKCPRLHSLWSAPCYYPEIDTLYTPCNGKYHLPLVLSITYRLKHVILVNDGKLLATASISW